MRGQPARGRATGAAGARGAGRAARIITEWPRRAAVRGERVAARPIGAAPGRRGGGGGGGGSWPAAAGRGRGAPRQGPRGAGGVILPSKGVRLSDSLLNTGAVLLRTIKSGQTVTEIWDAARPRPEVRTFERFVMGMDLLFILGAVRLEDGLIVRSGGHAYRRPDAKGPGQGKTAVPAH